MDLWRRIIRRILALSGIEKSTVIYEKWRWLMNTLVMWNVGHRIPGRCALRFDHLLATESQPYLGLLMNIILQKSHYTHTPLATVIYWLASSVGNCVPRPRSSPGHSHILDPTHWQPHLGFLMNNILLKTHYNHRYPHSVGHSLSWWTAERNNVNVL